MKKTIAEQLGVKEFPFEIKDSNGNDIYFEDSNRYWHKREYDSNGKPIYLENSNREWYKIEYDSNGKLIYYENSNRFTHEWYKIEYDSNGNKIYYENSSGFVEDNRPKTEPNDMSIEIDGKKI